MDIRRYYHIFTLPLRHMENNGYKYNSLTIACFIVASANERHLAINMTKLQKLLYIAYGTYLAIIGRRLTDEHPQAWPYGPVFPTTRSRLLKKDLSCIDFSLPILNKIKEDEEMKSLINLVLNGFGNKSATTLTVWSHQSGSPWDRIASQEDFTWGAVIPDEYIKEYFSAIIIRKSNGHQ